MGRMSNKPKQFNADMKVRSKFSDVAGLHEAKDVSSPARDAPSFPLR